MEKYTYYAGRTPVGGSTSEDDCCHCNTYEEAKQWLIEELQDGFDCEELEEYAQAISLLNNKTEGRFQFQIMHYVWFIIPEKQNVVPILENVMKAYEELFSRLMTCKHCNETVVGPPADGMPVFKQDAMRCSFCGNHTPLTDYRPYEDVVQFMQFLHKQDRNN